MLFFRRLLPLYSIAVSICFLFTLLSFHSHLSEHSGKNIKQYGAEYVVHDSRAVMDPPLVEQRQKKFKPLKKEKLITKPKTLNSRSKHIKKTDNRIEKLSMKKDIIQEDDDLTRKFTVAHITQEELSRLRDVGLFEHLLQPNDSRVINVFADRTSRLAFCAILKSASTVMLAALCKKAGRLPLDQAPKLNGAEIHSGCAQWLGRILTIHDKEWSNEKWKFWVLVRDPFERFLSGWNDKCSSLIDMEKMQKFLASHPGHKFMAKACYGCYGNATCFLQREVEVLQHLRARLDTPHAYHNSSKWALHMHPQMWFGGLQRYYDRYMIIRHGRSEEFQVWMRGQFSKAGYNATILNQGWGEDGKQAFLEQASMNKANERRLTVRVGVADEIARSIDMTEFYLRSYIVDHVFLRYKLPDWTAALCEKCKKSDRTDCAELMLCRVHRDWKDVLEMIGIY